MIRKHVYFKDSQIDFFENFNGLTFAEHVRRAVDQYIDKLRPGKSSASLSNKKEGDNK